MEKGKYCSPEINFGPLLLSDFIVMSAEGNDWDNIVSDDDTIL